MTTAIVKSPSLIDGHDKDAAKQLVKLYSDAQTGMRRIVALGLFAWELKETRLKHGQFGPWLASNCPNLATTDTTTNNAKPSRALQSYMELTKGVLESVGFTVEKYLAHISNAHEMRICRGGKYLLLPDKKLPEEVRPLKDKICELIDGKTKKQLFSEFKQAAEDENGNTKPKRGNMSGKGNPKENREAAKLAEEEARITELTLSSEDIAKWLLEKSDHKNIGMLDDQHFANLLTACETATSYMRQVIEARKAQRAV